MNEQYADCHPLIVEDDQDFTRILTRTLEMVGVPRLQIRSCSNGEEAIALLAKGERKPSYLTLDLHMPKRSGLEVLEWIRSSAPIADLPVFMLTNSSDPDHINRAFQLGVESYFIKPTDLKDLEEILQGIVAFWKARHRTRVIRGSLSP